MDSERFLTHEEIDLLFNMTISAESFWNVIIASANARYHEEVRELFHDDERVRVFPCRNGCDTLIAAVRNIPDLLIIDEAGIPDVKCSNLIQCIREDERLHLMRILCRLREDPGDSIPDWGADDYLLPGSEIDKIYISRKMHTQLYASGSYREEYSLDSHERFWPRARLNIKTVITVADPDQPESLNRGEAIIENISLGGALLSDIRLEHGSVPCGSVVMTLHIEQPVLEGLNADTRIIHCESDGKTGVKFLSLSREDRLRITDLFVR